MLQDEDDTSGPIYVPHHLMPVGNGKFVIVGIVPLLDKIMLINDPKNFKEYVGIRDTDTKGGITDLGFFIEKGKITGVYDHYDPKERFNENIEKYLALEVKEISKFVDTKGSWFNALQSIFKTIRNYDSFLKKIKKEE